MPSWKSSPFSYNWDGNVLSFLSNISQPSKIGLFFWNSYIYLDFPLYGFIKRGCDGYHHLNALRGHGCDVGNCCRWALDSFPDLAVFQIPQQFFYLSLSLPSLFLSPPQCSMQPYPLSLPLWFLTSSVRNTSLSINRFYTCHCFSVAKDAFHLTETLD